MLSLVTQAADALPTWFNVVGNVGSFGALLITLFWLGPKLLERFSDDLRAQRDDFLAESKANRESCEKEAQFQRELMVAQLAAERSESNRRHAEVMTELREQGKAS